MGASFVEQIIAVFSTESNFNVIVTSSTNEQITTAKMQEVNTPFGKLLNSIAREIIAKHIKYSNLGNWSNDFSYILFNLCSDSWSTRLISKHMCSEYHLKKPCLSLKVLRTYCKLLNSIQSNLSQSYSSLSQTCTFEEKTITLPVRIDVMMNVQEDLVRIMTQQYVGCCLLGNRSQVDFTIQ